MVKLIIRLYQSLMYVKRSILMTFLGYHSVCKHTPSCSQYTLEQIEKNGTITGLWQGLCRVATCF